MTTMQRMTREEWYEILNGDVRPLYDQLGMAGWASLPPAGRDGFGWLGDVLLSHRNVNFGRHICAEKTTVCSVIYDNANPVKIRNK